MSCQRLRCSGAIQSLQPVEKKSFRVFFWFFFFKTWNLEIKRFELGMDCCLFAVMKRPTLRLRMGYNLAADSVSSAFFSPLLFCGTAFEDADLVRRPQTPTLKRAGLVRGGAPRFSGPLVPTPASPRSSVHLPLPRVSSSQQWQPASPQSPGSPHQLHTVSFSQPAKLNPAPIRVRPRTPSL